MQQKKDYSFLFVDARFGGAGSAYNGGTNKRKKDGNKKQKREDGDGNPPNDQDPDDDDDDKDSEDDNTPNVDGHKLSGNNTCQQTTPKLALYKPGAKLPTLH